MPANDQGDREGDARPDNVVPLPLADRDPVDQWAELLGLDDEDDEEFLQEWDEVDQDASLLVREALPEVMAAPVPRNVLHAAAAGFRSGVADGRWPHRHVAAAAGWRGTPPVDDVELWLSAAGAFVAMRDESGMDAHAESTLMTLEHADWLGAVIGQVRAGVGSRAEPADLVAHINATPEVDGIVDAEDAPLVKAGFELVLPVWEAIGALDGHRRLTPLGWWGLPRALVWAWDGDGVSGDDDDQ